MMNMQYIDLTMPLSSATPVYPGDPKVEIQVAGQLEKDGYLDHRLLLGTHSGTHIDAPAHMIADGKFLSDFTIDNFIGPGVTVDVRNDLSIENIRQADIREGDIVLLYTGTSEQYTKPDYYEVYPKVPESVADYLVGKKVKIVGVDTGSVDHEAFTVHTTLLGNDILIIENLVNLGQIVGKRILVHVLPLNVEVEGSPARVVAQVMSSEVES